MNGTTSESHRTGEEARRGAASGTSRSGTDRRYDAMLRYLRGLYVRSQKPQQTTAAPNPPTEPKAEPSGQSEEAAGTPVEAREPRPEPGEPEIEPKSEPPIT